MCLHIKDSEATNSIASKEFSISRNGSSDCFFLLFLILLADISEFKDRMSDWYHTWATLDEAELLNFRYITVHHHIWARFEIGIRWNPEINKVGSIALSKQVHLLWCVI